MNGNGEHGGQRPGPRRGPPGGGGPGGPRRGPPGPAGGRGERGGHGGHGRPGRGDRDRGPGAGKAGAEHGILGALHELERPLTTGDFEAQKAPLTKILDRLKPLRLKSLDDLEFDARTRLFTALLRAGRQVEASEPEKEAKRKDVLFLLAEIWRAAGDERRAGLLYSASGRSGPAMQLLKQSGAWFEAAQIQQREGKPLEAARTFEQHQEYAAALEAYKAAGDAKGRLRAALLAGNLEEARAAARELPLPAARELLFKHKQGDLYLDLLSRKGQWAEIAQLYERAEQWLDAAQAYERARRLIRAAVGYKKGGDSANAERCIGLEVEARLGRGDKIAAGEALHQYGAHERAAELVQEQRPDLAFKFLQEGGLDAQAIAFAQARASVLADQSKPGEAARWLERAGELPAAGEAWLAASAPREALRVWEQLGDWERAGDAAARAGMAEQAVSLLRRAGVADPEERVKRLMNP